MDVNTSLRTRWGRMRRGLPGLGLACLLGSTGCLSLDQINPFSKPPPPIKPPTESLILGPEGFVEDNKQVGAVLPPELAGVMATAREHFRKEEYDKALLLFERISDNEKNTPASVQEAMYYRAECERLTGDYPKAGDVYSGLLGKYPNSPYREQCVQHMYDIANFWLEDTRKEMQEEKEYRDGKRWIVWPHFISFEHSKPFLDREGRAIELLEKVRLHDINGPLADQALFMCGVVKMFNENYRDADHYFSQIPLRHAESKLAPKALELAIFCKHMSTGGSDYDGRKAAEARKMVQMAMRSYPQLANDPAKRKFLEQQIVSIDMQQAEKDFKMAEFYRRTGHPGSAYFYYELCRRRYPHTEFARKSEERWNSLREEQEKEHEGAPLRTAGSRVPAPAANGSGWNTTPAPGPRAVPAGRCRQRFPPRAACNAAGAGARRPTRDAAGANARPVSS